MQSCKASGRVQVWSLESATIISTICLMEEVTATIVVYLTITYDHSVVASPVYQCLQLLQSGQKVVIC